MVSSTAEDGRDVFLLRIVLSFVQFRAETNLQLAFVIAVEAFSDVGSMDQLYSISMPDFPGMLAS